MQDRIEKAIQGVVVFIRTYSTIILATSLLAYGFSIGLFEVGRHKNPYISEGHAHRNYQNTIQYLPTVVVVSGKY